MAKVERALARPASELDRIVSLLGGDHMFSPAVRSPLDAHEAILKGFSNRALTHLVGNVAVMQQADVMEKAVGISLRTFQRRKKEGAHERLSREQSGRLYKAAEIVAKAIDIFGSTAAAEDFLEKPAMALDGERPIELLATPAGAELVERHLAQLDLGVYV